MCVGTSPYEFSAFVIYKHEPRTYNFTQTRDDSHARARKRTQSGKNGHLVVNKDSKTINLAQKFDIKCIQLLRHGTSPRLKNLLIIQFRIDYVKLIVLCFFFSIERLTCETGTDVCYLLMLIVFMDGHVTESPRKLLLRINLLHEFCVCRINARSFLFVFLVTFKCYSCKIFFIAYLRSLISASIVKCSLKHVNILFSLFL